MRGQPKATVLSTPGRQHPSGDNGREPIAERSDPGTDREHSHGSRREIPGRRSSFPHRKTIDLTVEQHSWLNAQSYNARVSTVGIVRAALDYLAETPDALADVLAAAHAAEHPEFEIPS